MTNEKFDNYSFSMYTEVKLEENGAWFHIRSVDFERRIIELSPYEFISHDQIIDIRN